MNCKYCLYISIESERRGPVSGACLAGLAALASLSLLAAALGPAVQHDVRPHGALAQLPPHQHRRTPALAAAPRRHSGNRHAPVSSPGTVSIMFKLLSYL